MKYLAITITPFIWHCHIDEPGDWEFSTVVDEDGTKMGDLLDVIAWRPEKERRREYGGEEV